MLMCRSPPFLPENKQTKKNGGNKMPKEYYLYVNGQKPLEMLYQDLMQKKRILLNACISMMKRFVQWQSLKVLHIQP